MKKFMCIMFLMFITTDVMAQEELKINDIFEEKAFVLKSKTESYIQGKALKDYKLNVLHTLKFTATGDERNEVERLFRDDIKDVNAHADDNLDMEIRDGHLYYAVAQLSNYHGKHRYVCYQCRKTDDGYRVTLAYMRGEATMKELRKMFKK